MASSSSSPSVLAFSSHMWKYHVFLSFRGEDTRKTFEDHLYTALEQKGIYTYKDDETLPRGVSIGPSLMTAIEESQIAVIIFSKNYADSSWCLEELTHIMECQKTRGQIPMPIFYDVDPSDIRRQKRKYGEAFLKHELENKEKVESWRKALVDASNFSGWEPKHIANGHESKCIKEIVDTISHRLRPIISSVDDSLVGVKDRMQDLMLKLQIGFGGKRMIGIWGVGGGGKTTLASSIYDEISSKFDGCCFIKNVREESSIKNGLEKLQEEILSDVLEQKQVKVRRVEEGRRMTKDRLQHRKVLIVLDDGDNLQQLEELAGSCDWFGEGSRIIITTRDEHVLTGHRVDMIYNISLLNNDEAMKLFCKHAPRGDRCTEDYKLLSEEVVSYSGGLPLALRVLGRLLCDKEMKEWRSALARLKEIPDSNILEKLKISFDGLEPVERELFLDIACFFRWKEKNRHLMTLEACGFHPVIGIRVLIQKALITVSEDGRFDMHDLVEEMAHHIVRGEDPTNPAKHSRIWKQEDFQTILAMDATENFDKIEAISVKWSSITSDERQRVLQVVADMKKLRSIDLKVDGLCTLPDNFPQKELCCLTLRLLRPKQLWEGYKFLPNLRMITLRYLSKLIKTPDFNGLPNLETFMIHHSPLLEEIDPSFGHLEKLLHVAIQFCDNLKMLPPITRSKKLETLELYECRKVFTSSNNLQNMENSLPRNMNHIGQWFFSGCLRKLELSRCNLTDGHISSLAVWELPNLQELDISRNKFIRLSFSHIRLPRLKFLDVSHNEGLVELSELPSTVAVFKADHCDSKLWRYFTINWLWKVSFQWKNKLGPCTGDMLLNSILQGNARDYFFSIRLSGIDVKRGQSVPWVDLVTTYNILLPHDWCNHFSGILMFVNFKQFYLGTDISIKQGVDEDFHSQVGQESNETVFGAHYENTHVGYVSFGSLRHTACLNLTYNIISFSKKTATADCRFRVILVPKDDLMQTSKAAIDSSQFWDEKDQYGRKTFTIQHDSNSSIKIVWNPESN